MKRSLSIAQRLHIGFAAVALLLAAVSIVGFAMQSVTRRETVDAVEKSARQLAMATSMRENILKAGLRIRNVGLQSEVATMNAELAAFKQAVEDYRATRDALRKDTTGLTIFNDAWTAIDHGESTTLPLADQAAGYATLFEPEQAMATLSKKVSPAQEAWLASIGELVARLQTQNQANVAATFERNGRISAALLTLGVCAALLAQLAAWRLTHRIVEPLKRAVRVAKMVASQDLTLTIERQASDETGQLLTALGQMSEKLSAIVSEVRTGSDSILLAAEEIADANASLSTRTESQAAALQQTAATMAEMAQTVKDNAARTGEANALAVQASAVATQGTEAVSEVMASMKGLTSSASKVQDIVGLIESIAFQTNILALNAAVEAARAGAAGRGFAVVAAEVRTLAHRCTSAAREVAVLISGSEQEVTLGTERAKRAGDAIGQVERSVRDLQGVVASIAKSSSEQALGIEQVNQAVSMIDEATQQTSTLVEEAAATASMMRASSARLADTVGVFKVRPTSGIVLLQ